MVSFILNEREINTEAAAGSSLLDFIRRHERLVGTKSGCREGDCGACTVLEGRLKNGRIEYRSIVSCLSPLGNAHGKHIVTIEGINCRELSPAQKAIADNGGTQCGFCTPGFVMSLTAFSLQNQPPLPARAIEAMSGNICRCTGYKSIERAAETISEIIRDKNLDNPLGWLVSRGFLPSYFTSIPERLAAIDPPAQTDATGSTVIAGGTDILVQKPDETSESDTLLLFDDKELKEIRLTNDRIIIGASVTASGIMNSQLLKTKIPRLYEYFRLISSEPVRNMGTIGGNICNASPIADLVIFFMALDAHIDIKDPNKEGERSIPLKDLYRGYKELDLHEGEIVKQLHFRATKADLLFNFEKVSKRRMLDIASVNSAMSARLTKGILQDVRLTMGGVAPVPLFLDKCSSFLNGRRPGVETILECNQVLQEEISPISDIRGSKEYKRLLARQLLAAHFTVLFPEYTKSGNLIERLLQDEKH